MKQITEDYVSAEIAQLLREKGFNEDVTTFYNSNGEFEYCSFPLNHNLDIGSGFVSAPSQSLALKWLREVHKIHIAINVGCDVDNKNYVFYTPTIVILSSKSVEYIEPFSEDDNEFDSNEQAIEAALKYTLENLI